MDKTLFRENSFFRIGCLYLDKLKYKNIKGLSDNMCHIFSNFLISSTCDRVDLLFEVVVDVAAVVVAVVVEDSAFLDVIIVVV